MGVIGSLYRNLLSRKPIRVVIVGANFAGLEVALALPDRFEVIAIDPQPFFEFLPNIHELVSGIKKPHMLRFSKDRILRHRNRQFLQDEVQQIDPWLKKVITESGIKFDYDFCVVSTGGINNTFGVANADQLSMPFKSVQQCHNIGIHLHHLVTTGAPQVVIVGGGLEGIEALGEILRKYRSYGNLKIQLIESNERLLPGFPNVMDKDIRELCRPYPVAFHTGKRVQRIASGELELTSGEILKADVIIWTGGAKAAPLLKTAGLCKANEPWAPVNNTLKSRYFDHIFVAGDAAQLPQTIEKQAYHAIDMGKLVAANIQRLVAGNTPAEFRPSAKPALLSFGDLETFLISGNLVVAGPALATLKEGVYQYIMARYDPGALRVLSTAKRASSSLSAFLSTSSLWRLPHLRILQS